MRVISVVNKKGGVGKTTTAFQLASWLEAHYSGRTLAVDMDSQANFSYTAQSSGRGVGTYEVLTHKLKIKDAIEYHEGTFDLLAGTGELDTADSILNEPGKEFILKEALADIAPKYEYVVIDTPPKIGILTTNALVASDRTIIVAQSDTYSMQGILGLSDKLQRIKKYYNTSLVIDGILLTRYDSNANAKHLRAEFEKLAARIGTKLYRTVIRETTYIKESQSFQKSIFAHTRKGHGAEDYRAFCSEFIDGYDAGDDDEIAPI